MREHARSFRSEWTGALRAISRQCPSAASECVRLLALDPLEARNDAAIGATVARIQYLSYPRTIRSMKHEAKRLSFGTNLRLERGLAFACKQAAKRLCFRSHSPEHYQLVAYEAGRLGAHPRTVRVIAAALGVAVDQIYG